MHRVETRLAGEVPQRQLLNSPRSSPAESGKAHTLQVSVGNKNAEIKEDPERVTVYEHESGERLSSHSGERHVSSDSVRSHLRWIAP